MTDQGPSPALRPNPHPAISGREQELADLADQVRRLIGLTVTCDAPRAELSDLAGQLRQLNDRLAGQVPAQARPRFWAPEADESAQSAPAPRPRGESQAGDGIPDQWDPRTMIDSMPYDVVVGRYNPLAPPLTIEIRPPKAYATARFTTAYEGAPGWVHGAVIAGAFDIVLTAANHLEAASGPTTRLEIRYLRPTLLAEEADFEAWIEHRRGNRVVSKGRLLQQGKVKVEAEGEFVTLDRQRLSRLQANRGEPER